jgi:hypothetical protein
MYGIDIAKFCCKHHKKNLTGSKESFCCVRGGRFIDSNIVNVLVEKEAC